MHRLFGGYDLLDGGDGPRGATDLCSASVDGVDLRGCEAITRGRAI